MLPSTPSRSRFNAAVGDATDSVSDCEVGTWEPAQEDAAALATEGVEDWAESEQKRLVQMHHGIAVPIFVAVSVCVRARVCVRVFSSGLSLYFKSFKSLRKSRQGFSFLVSIFCFPFLFVVVGFQCKLLTNVRGVSWSEVATVPKRKSHRGLDLDLSLNSEVNIRKGWKENSGTK